MQAARQEYRHACEVVRVVLLLWAVMPDVVEAVVGSQSGADESRGRQGAAMSHVLRTSTCPSIKESRCNTSASEWLW